MVYLLCLSFPSLERGVRSNAFTSRWNDLIWLHPYSHQRPLSRKWNIKKHTVAEFCDPGWVFHHCYTPHCTLRARYFKAPSSPGSPPSMILPSYGLLSQKTPYHFSHPCSTVPLVNTLEISFIFVRQDKIEASPGATNNSMHIISFFSFFYFPQLKVAFLLGQNLIEKPRFVLIAWRQIITVHTFRASKRLSQESI